MEGMGEGVAQNSKLELKLAVGRVTNYLAFESQCTARHEWFS